jgi:RNA polymerase-binding transcription factor DksA
MTPILVWQDLLETCDVCGDIYPLSRIKFTGTQFICADCDTEKEQPK